MFIHDPTESNLFLVTGLMPGNLSFNHCLRQTGLIQAQLSGKKLEHVIHTGAQRSISWQRRTPKVDWFIGFIVAGGEAGFEIGREG